MSERAAPTIELYMHSLNQEFPKEKGHQHFLRRNSATREAVRGNDLERIEQVESEVFQMENGGDWSVQWISNEWIENHTKAAGVGLIEEADPMERAILREEDFGGILFEPTSDRVFRLNREGFELFSSLRERYRRGERDLEKLEIAGFASEDVRAFVAYLEGASLWVRE